MESRAEIKRYFIRHAWIRKHLTRIFHRVSTDASHGLHCPHCPPIIYITKSKTFTAGAVYILDIEFYVKIKINMVFYKFI